MPPTNLWESTNSHMKKSIRRDVFAATIGALMTLLAGLLWSLSKSDVAVPCGVMIEDSVKKNEDLPAMTRGDFFSPHLSIEDLLTDNFLDSLIRGSMKKEVIDSMYGRPLSEAKTPDSVTASYNLAIYDKQLRLKGGRVGFVATFKNGSIVNWNPIIQESLHK